MNALSVVLSTGLLVGAVLVGITILIVVHEMGHHLACRLTDIGVIRFSVGFGPPLFSRWIGRTRYTICPFLFGGYVLPAGKSDLSDENASEALRKKLDDEKCPDHLREYFLDSKHWITHVSEPKKIFVSAAGPLASLVAGYLIILVLCLTLGKKPQLESNRVTIIPESPAAAAGMLTGDIITSIGGNPFKTIEDLEDALDRNRDLRVEVLRDGVARTFVLIRGKGAFGLSFQMSSSRMTASDCVSLAARVVRRIFVGTMTSLRMLIQNPRERGAELRGIVGIVDVGTQVSRGGIEHYLQFLGVLSIGLAIMNLLPIPILDGWGVLTGMLRLIRPGLVPKQLDLALRSLATVFLLTSAVYFLMNDSARVWAQIAALFR